MFDPEFVVATGFAIFIGLAIYLGVHKKAASALDGRASRIEAELAEATKLRTEAEALLASFERRSAEAKAEAEAVVAQAHAEAAAHRQRGACAHHRIHPAPDEAGGRENQHGGNASDRRCARRRRRCRGQSRGSCFEG